VRNTHNKLVVRTAIRRKKIIRVKAPNLKKDENKGLPTHGWTGPETGRSALRWVNKDDI